MEKQNKVIAKLIKSYDLSPSGSHDVKSIHYFNIYEFEYNGKKYNYSEIINDNFDKNLSEIELFFDDDPNKAYRASDNTNLKMTKNEKFLVTVFFSFLFVVFIYFLITSFKIFIEKPIMFIILLFLFIIAILIAIKKKKKKKSFNELLADSLLNNRTAIAYLKKSQYIFFDSDNTNEYYEKTIQYNPYRAKYEYEYNGRKYRKVLHFSEIPPSIIKVYFNKNPRDIFYYTK